MTTAICAIARRRHPRLIVEDAAEMLAVGKDLGLMGQIGAAGIDQIDAGQTVLRRDLLRAQVLLHGHRIIGAALDGRIVGDDHRLPAVDEADPGHEPRAVDVALVHAEGRERADLEEGRTGIDQPRDALAGQQLAPRDMALARLCRAALGRRRGGAPRVRRGALASRRRSPRLPRLERRARSSDLSFRALPWVLFAELP